MLWPWSRLSAAAPIRTLAWEPPYAASVALKSKRKKEFNGISKQMITSRIRGKSDCKKLRNKHQVRK